MKVKEFKRIAELLGRFATTREKSNGPEYYIGVQKRGEVLKLISGKSTAAMVVTVGEHDSVEGNFSFSIPARPFLQAAKVLPARSSVTIRTTKNGLHIQAEGGGTIDIGATDTALRDIGFPKKPKKWVARGSIDAKNLKRMSKMFKSVCAKVTTPSVQTVNGTGYAVALAPGNGSRYTNYRFPTEVSDNSITEYAMAAYRTFWDALTHFDEDGVLSWGRDGVLLESGNYACYSAPYLVSGYDRATGGYTAPEEVSIAPIMVATALADTSFTIERKTLVELVKGQMAFDEHNRITLEVNDGSLRVMPFGSTDGMDVDCEASGKGIRSVDSGYLLGYLNAMDAKKVTLRWSGGVPAVSISAEDYDSWTILLAPAGL